MSLPRDLIGLALRVSGITGLGQVASTTDVNDAFTMLNQMAAQWARKRWLVPHLLDVALPLTGAASYTVGSGGALNIVRPDRIEYAYYRLRPSAANPVDYPLAVIDNHEDWAAVQLKSLRSLPAAVFYDTSWPLATLYVYPVTPIGSSVYELHILVKDGMGAFASLDADTGLPPEYDAALLYNLAARLRPAYGLGPDGSVTALALDALNTIRKANTQIPLARMPAGLPGTGRGSWGSWAAGLGGAGGDPAFNSAQGFQLGLSPLNGMGILL